MGRMEDGRWRMEDGKFVGWALPTEPDVSNIQGEGQVRRDSVA